MNRGRAAPLPSLADSESLWAAQQLLSGSTVSPSLDSTGKECFTTNLSFRGQSLAEQQWAFNVLTSDVRVMAGAGPGSAAGPAPADVRHQPAGTVRRECRFQGIYTMY